MRPGVTVLTKEIRSLPRRLYQRARSTIRPFVKPGAPLPPVSPYPGHASLVRSVVEGLTRVGASFNFNPESFSDLAPVVYAPANEALRQAASIKRKKGIRRLIAGPVNALDPDECDGVLRLPEINRIIVASDWAKVFFTETPELLRKIRVCPSGVDPDAWKPPTGRGASDKVLVYRKRVPEDVSGVAEAIIRRSGRTPVELRYGEYEVEAYRALLTEVDLCVFLSPFETQGLALAEAWAMNRPTLVWDPRAETEWRGRRFRAGSSCPYLTEATGLAFRDIDALEPALRSAISDPARFSPRRWVIEHMTDTICARRLLEILKEE